jgi:hypothetical protein
MRIAALTIASFTMGAICMFLVGTHMSIFRQPVLVFAQDVNQGWVASVPRVPPLPDIAISHNTKRVGGELGLDGQEIRDSTFTGVTFFYGGGAFKLINSTMAPPINLKLVGAAANTYALLSYFGEIGCPAKAQQQPQFNPNIPILKRTDLAARLQGNFVSPFNGNEE